MGHDPEFLNGTKNEDQIFKDFLKNFDSPSQPDGKVGVAVGVAMGRWV